MFLHVCKNKNNVSFMKGSMFTPSYFTFLEDLIIIMFTLTSCFLPEPSTFPSDLTETAVTSHSISVAWNPVSQDNGIITGYTIQVQQVFPSPGEPYSIVTDTSSTYAITGLQPNSTYRVRVAAHTSAGAGDYSPSVDVQTAEKGKINHSGTLTPLWVFAIIFAAQ